MPLADILPFKKPTLKERARQRTLCSRGFHKWEIERQRHFDVRRGKLITVYRCTRCDAVRNKLT